MTDTTHYRAPITEDALTELVPLLDAMAQSPSVASCRV
jgi:hypothetical protein